MDITPVLLKRRRFLGTLTAAGTAISLPGLGLVQSLPCVSAADASLPADAVKFSAEIEPLVRLLEETPRQKVVEVFANKVRGGTSYREVLAALLLAGVRNVQPRPSVGFKFHAVLVVNSAHLASLASPDSDRWLPIFWALDYFKSSQESDASEGDWTLSTVNESKVPSASQARKEFRRAMDAWDVEAADVATASLCRAVGANEVFDLMAHYGCRDYRSIGHKAIYVANAYRTLQCIGWQYAEPVLRSLTYALLNHTGEPNPSESDLAPDAAWRKTTSDVAQINKDWKNGRIDTGATLALLDTFKTATPTEAIDATTKLLAEGISVQSISDAIFLASGEMLIQQPGIVSLHAATTTNAMQYAFRTAYRTRTRQELLLQNAAFIPYFRESMRGRGKVGETRIDVRDEASSDPETATVESIFASVSKDRGAASRAMLGYLDDGGAPLDVMDAARRLVFLKGKDAHDYKFSSAVLEDYFAISPEFRNRYLASSAFLLPGSGDKDNGLVDRVQQAMA